MNTTVAVIEEKENQEENGSPKERANQQYRKFLWNVFKIYSGLLALLIFLSQYTIVYHGIEWSWGRAMFFAIIIYTVRSCFNVVPEDKLGARLFLGEPIDNVTSGWVFAPHWFFSIKTETRLLETYELPDEADKVWRDDEDQASRVGKRDPIRIPFGKLLKKKSGVSKGTVVGQDLWDVDALDQRLTEVVVPVVQCRISDYVLFLTELNSMPKAKKTMEDLFEAALSEDFGTKTVAHVLENLKTTNKDLTKHLKASMEGRGLLIERAYIKVIRLSHELNGSIETIAKKTATAKADLIEAAGKMGAMKKETEGLLNRMIDLKINGLDVLGADTAVNITKSPGQKTIIVGQAGFKEIIGIGHSILESASNHEAVKNEPVKEPAKKPTSPEKGGKK